MKLLNEKAASADDVLLADEVETALKSMGIAACESTAERRTLEAHIVDLRRGDSVPAVVEVA